MSILRQDRLEMKSRVRRALILAVLGVLLLAMISAAPAAPETVSIGPGATHTRIHRPEGPWAINVVEADLSQQFLRLKSLVGIGEMADGALMIGRQTVGEMMAAHAGETARAQDRPETAASPRPVAGVNGDFFALAGQYYATTALGLQIEDGDLITLPDPARSVLYLLRDGTLHIGRFRATSWLRGPRDLLYEVSGINRSPGYADLVVFTPAFGDRTWAEEGTTQFALVGLSGPLRPNGEVTGRIASIAVAQSQRIPPDGAVLAARGVAAYALRRLEVGEAVRLSVKMEPETGDILEAVGGGPRLVRDGVMSVEHLEERFSEQFASRRHPRTGAGIRGNTLVMVTVDGRQRRYSQGMTLPEFAELFLELGCTDAMNLDGGGSTTMVVRDSIVNSPSSGAPRAVANALGLFSTAPAGPPEHLAIEPTEVSVLSGDRVMLHATGLDKYYGPVPVRREDLEWKCASALGRVDEAGMFTATEVSVPTTGLVLARCGDLTAASVVRVVPGPAQVVVSPSDVTLAPGEVQQFSVYAYDAANQAVRLPMGAVAWSCEPAQAAGLIDDSGLLRAPSTPCRIKVVACVGEVKGEATVVVTTGPKALEDFEQEREWSYRASPSEVPGSVEWRQDPLQPENHCLGLKYDFSTQAGIRTAYMDLDLTLPETRTLSLRVLGDGKGGWLRARLRDGFGRVFTVDLADRVDWSGEWRFLTVALPEGIEAPVTLESVYMAEYHSGRKPVGQIFVDDISAARGTKAEEPVEAGAAQP